MPSLGAVVGIILILLFFSLLASIVMEVISGYISLRGKRLERILQGLLSSEDRREELIKDFKDNPLYKQMEGSVYGKSAPLSYLSSEIFKSILFHVIASRKEGTSFLEKIQHLPDEHLKNTLLLFWEEANQDFGFFSEKVKSWYEQVMERASGWYKRDIQRRLLLIGIVIAVVFNVDILSVYSNLVHYTLIDSGKFQIFDDPLGLGWSSKDYSSDVRFWMFKIFGWLLTTVCISKCAPFCFDLLNKIVNFRDTGVRPLPETLQEKPQNHPTPRMPSAIGTMPLKTEELERQPVG